MTASPAAAQSPVDAFRHAEAELAEGQQPSVDEAIDTLLSIIKDEHARNALIQRLEAPQDRRPRSNRRKTSEEDGSIARRLADLTTGTVQTVYESVQFWPGGI